MTFLPIVERELRVASRKRSIFTLRFGAAAIVVLIWFVLSALGAGLPQSGFVVFMALTIGTFAFCLMGGVWLTADCVSEEKRDGTLGLLFLTDLSGHEVILGKLAATSLRGVYGVLAVFPVLALPFLTGGVGLGDFWRVIAVLLATLFLSLSVGLLLSVLNHETRSAMFGTAIALGILTVLPWLLWWLAGNVFYRGNLPPNFLLWLSPVFAFRAAFEADYGMLVGVAPFWFSCGLVFSLGMAAITAASVMIPKVWRETGEEAADPRRTGSYRVRFGSEGERRERRSLLEENPFYWLRTRDRSPQFLLWLVLGIVWLLWFCFWVGCFVSGTGGQEKALLGAVFTAFALHLFLKCFVAVEATRQFCEDRQSSALELLLVTPQPVVKIVEGVEDGLRRLFHGPMILLCLTNVAMLAIVFSGALRMRAAESEIFCMIIVVGAVLLPLDCFALRWVGMRTALTSTRHHRAAMKTLAQVMLIPWLVTPLFVFLGFAVVGMRGEDRFFIVLLWFVIVGAFDVTRGLAVTNSLATDLRFAVSEGRDRGMGSPPAEISPVPERRVAIPLRW
ncbi:MAG: ABC transporter permease [Pedosphaera sp.]|nr:ABC transporter permease [Pedosphaera sp.]